MSLNSFILSRTETAEREDFGRQSRPQAGDLVLHGFPVESIVKENKEEYYRAISLSTAEGKSNHFVLFMPGVIKKTVSDLARDARGHRIHLSNQVKTLMIVIVTYPMSAVELMEKHGLKSREAFRKKYLRPALEAGLTAMTDPNMPIHRSQRYFRVLTPRTGSDTAEFFRNVVKHIGKIKTRLLSAAIVPVVKILVRK